MSTTSAPAIEARDVVKTFGSTRALDGLDLVVAFGEVHGFLGPNGSGKSTTIRVLLGMLRADSGRVRLLGLIGTYNRRMSTSKVQRALALAFFAPQQDASS